MEREITLTGIGGQGIQLGAQVLARAAALEDREVLLFGSYGGTMRGGPTDSTLIVGDGPISAPPIVSQTWSAIAMHHEFWEPVARKLRPGAVVLVNASLFEAELDPKAQRVFELPATQLATEAGSTLAASMVLVGAFAGVTGLVGVESLVRALSASLPARRQQHFETNERALRAGFNALPHAAAPAWDTEEDA